MYFGRLSVCLSLFFCLPLSPDWHYYGSVVWHVAQFQHAMTWFRDEAVEGMNEAQRSKKEAQENVEN